MKIYISNQAATNGIDNAVDNVNGSYQHLIKAPRDAVVIWHQSLWVGMQLSILYFQSQYVLFWHVGSSMLNAKPEQLMRYQ